MDDELQIRVPDDKLNPVLSPDTVSASNSVESASADATEINELQIEIEEPVMTVTIEGGGITVQGKSHNQLQDLDYEHAGHTGFASSAQITALNNRVSDVESDVTSLNNRVSDIEEAIDDLSEKIDNKITTETVGEPEKSPYYFKLLD